MNIDERKLRRIVNESIEEMLNAPGRDPNANSDGKYNYLGLGTPESDERMEKIHQKMKAGKEPWEWDRSYFARHGKDDSPYMRQGREYGDYKRVTTDNAGEERWDIFIDYLRNTASRNHGNRFDSYGLERYLPLLQTREGAAAFIKYLYMNGFDQKSR